MDLYKAICILFVRKSLVKAVTQHKNWIKTMQFLCYVTFSNADSRISILFETSNGRLLSSNIVRSARKIVKTRFRQFAPFHFSTLKTFLEMFLAKFGFVMDLLRIWLSRGLLFKFPREFKRAPVDRPKIAWKPAHPPGPLAEVSQQQDFQIVR